jgi:hypothetical protein
VRVASGEMEGGIAFCWRVGARKLGCGVFVLEWMYGGDGSRICSMFVGRSVGDRCIE